MYNVFGEYANLPKNKDGTHLANLGIKNINRKSRGNVERPLSWATVVLKCCKP